MESPVWRGIWPGTLSSSALESSATASARWGAPQAYCLSLNPAENCFCWEIHISKPTENCIKLFNLFHRSVWIAENKFGTQLSYGTAMSCDTIFALSVLHFSHSSRRFVFQHPQKSKHSLSHLLGHFLTYINGLLKQKIQNRQISGD